eukprot:268984-Pelagomonas_calceolata.AAC.2
MMHPPEPCSQAGSMIHVSWRKGSLTDSCGSCSPFWWCCEGAAARTSRGAVSSSGRAHEREAGNLGVERACLACGGCGGCALAKHCCTCSSICSIYTG